ncbi:MAG: PQQ-binding-like beta-propeller repeat protein [Planctomycetota bacterium]
MMNVFRFSALTALSLVLAGTFAISAQAADVAADPLDWPHWRGPEMNGISREKGLPASWDPSGENLLWKSPEMATRSTPIVLRGKIYTICRDKPETTQEGEKIVCADAATGKILWENINNIFLSDAPAERVGWSSVTGDPKTGHVFAQGLCGLLQCIDGETGKTLWSHSLSEEYGILSTYGGRTNLPTIFEDLVIVSGVTTGWGEQAIPAHRFIAFHKQNGQAVWVLSTKLRPEDTTYSTPVLGVFNGQAAMVFGAGDGAVYAVQPRTGKVIWKYDASIRGINQTPVIDGETVYCSHSEETIHENNIVGAFFALDGKSQGDILPGKEIWNVKGLAVGRSAPLLVNSRLYTINDSAGMVILDAKNGEEVGKQKLGTIMMGSSVYGDGKIYVSEATGRWWILEPTEKGVKIIHKLRLNDEELIGSPIISHGRVYIPSIGGVYCIANKDSKPSADPIPPSLPETPRDVDMKPAQAQLVPVESLLSTDKKQQFHFQLYNAAGRFLKSVPAKFTLDGPGTIDDSGAFLTGKATSHTTTIVKAEAEGLTAIARVRTVPPLPWSFDFADKKVPSTWIGAAYRYQPRDVDGEPLLVKVTTIPKGTRSQAWMGPTTLHDYTIQGEFMGDIKNEKMPDMGLINQRYTLALQGGQTVQVRSWTARGELRFAKTVPFEWKPKTWYVIKFQAVNEASKVVLKGKVWPRGESEPEAWTIDGIDDTPNKIGSPGLFGNATDAEIFVDNVKVTDNTPPAAAQ